MTVNSNKSLSQVSVVEEDTRSLSDSENENLSNNSNSDTESNNADSSENSDNKTDAAISNAGWADSISKILKTNKPKHKKTLVLSKAKKLNDIKRSETKPAGFQVETVDGKVRDEKIEINTELTEEQTEPPKKKKRELPSLRIKPNILEKDRERTLTKIATKGVVHLFNAVKSQQKDIATKLREAGPLEVRKDKVLKNVDKRAFLDVLMGEKSQDVNEVVKENAKQEQSESDSTWGVFRDDFMMSAKMKDWDKVLENEEREEECCIESD